MRSLWNRGFAVLTIALAVFAFGLQIGGGKPAYEVGGAQLAKDYREFAGLYADSSLVAVGSFSGRTRVIDNPANKDSRIKVLLQEFGPSQVVKGNTPSPIWIATYARYEKGSWLGAVGQAVYQGGSSYLLFLADSGEGYHWTTGAWQGSFRVQDGKAWSRYEVGESERTSLVTNGTALSTILDALPSTGLSGK